MPSAEMVHTQQLKRVRWIEGEKKCNGYSVFQRAFCDVIALSAR